MKLLRYSCWLSLYIFSTGVLHSQTSVEGKANELRTALKPYFVSVSRDDSFIKKNIAKINLGRKLFYDKKLSLGKGVSCNSCHDLQKYGTNGDYYLQQKAKGQFYRDVPTVYNSVSFELFNVDGSLSNFKNKIREAFLRTHEMEVQNEALVIQELKKTPEYLKMFREAFFKKSTSITFDVVIDALEAFLSQLKTPAPIDAFMEGNNTVLSNAQIQGGELFVSKACYSCHTGSSFGGQMINKLGVEVPWPNQKDMGYYHIKRKSSNKMFFRVAPLRNVAKTAPYFHDALAMRLDKAIKLMGIHERGIQLKVVEVAKIKEFLKSFTGEIPQDYIKEN
ncbi:cytochrome c peroxidase [Wenyingzhuangia heitensis]|uniref:Cytochrome c peroxidase n=1 Tax=Wenyingzhuangia heitensis TaxID=1487859 RepID=A0ABX0U7U0_9FLAO|nr:cytochrome c peroxidase [Wenyingzhuangia heitensis]NIJ44909.1 cytochrome c peroxidase [Wenyingzhuangia heitensis]